MRLVWTSEAPTEEPRPGPHGGFNHSSQRTIGVELDDGKIVIDTGIALGSFGSADYSSSYGSFDYAELVRRGDGWMIRVVNEAGDTAGPMNVGIVATYGSEDGKTWRKLELDEKAAFAGEQLSRLP